MAESQDCEPHVEPVLPSQQIPWQPHPHSQQASFSHLGQSLRIKATIAAYQM